MVKVILIGVGAIGTVPSGREKRHGELEIRGKIETIQTTLLLISAKILGKDLETRGELKIRRKIKTIHTTALLKSAEISKES